MLGLSNSAFPLALLYFGEMAAFSVSMLLVTNRRIESGVVIWIASNVIGAWSTIAGYPDMTPFSPYAEPFPVALSIVNLGLKRIALLPRRRRRESALRAWATYLAMFVGIVSAYTFEQAYRSAITCFAGAMLSLWTIPAIRANRSWQGYWGKPMVIASLYASGFFLVMRLMVTTPGILNDSVLRNASIAQGPMIAIIGMILSSVVLQAGFLGLLVAKQGRARLLDSRRLARASERTLSARNHAREIRILADQRLNLLNLLTHEVRQPIHNAQAALQGVIIELERGEYAPARVHLAARRTQAVLDEITLSLSNAITGTRLIEDDRIGQLRPVSMSDLAAMARLDCPAHNQKRINLQVPSADLYIEADPVLIRLALRNLLDNALKYSPETTPINFEVSEDVDRFGAVFRVTNQVKSLDCLHGDIFERAQRGASTYVEGQGLGLFIVSRVASLHHGATGMKMTGPNEVMFELFLPA